MTSGSTTSTSGAVNQSSEAPEPSYTGRAIRRFEDADLLRGHGRFGDDLPVRPDTLHAAILRSPHAHAEILSVDVAGALAVPGVDCVVTSEDARRWTRPFAVAVKTAMEQWCLAPQFRGSLQAPRHGLLAHPDLPCDDVSRWGVEVGNDHASPLHPARRLAPRARNIDQRTALVRINRKRNDAARSNHRFPLRCPPAAYHISRTLHTPPQHIDNLESLY